LALLHLACLKPQEQPGFLTQVNQKQHAWPWSLAFLTSHARSEVSPFSHLTVFKLEASPVVPISSTLDAQSLTLHQSNPPTSPPVTLK
jgi:hypothetical protein